MGTRLLTPIVFSCEGESHFLAKVNLRVVANRSGPVNFAQTAFSYTWTSRKLRSPEIFPFLLSEVTKLYQHDDHPRPPVLGSCSVLGSCYSSAKVIGFAYFF